jgi:hypothetical protein
LTNAAKEKDIYGVRTMIIIITYNLQECKKGVKPKERGSVPRCVCMAEPL